MTNKPIKGVEQMKTLAAFVARKEAEREAELVERAREKGMRAAAGGGEVE